MLGRERHRLGGLVLGARGDGVRAELKSTLKEREKKKKPVLCDDKAEGGKKREDRGTTRNYDSVQKFSMLLLVA